MISIFIGLNWIYSFKDLISISEMSHFATSKKDKSLDISIFPTKVRLSTIIMILPLKDAL